MSQCPNKLIVVRPQNNELNDDDGEQIIHVYDSDAKGVYLYVAVVICYIRVNKCETATNTTSYSYVMMTLIIQIDCLVLLDVPRTCCQSHI